MAFLEHWTSSAQPFPQIISTVSPMFKKCHTILNVARIITMYSILTDKSNSKRIEYVNWELFTLAQVNLRRELVKVL